MADANPFDSVDFGLSTVPPVAPKEPKNPFDAVDYGLGEPQSSALGAFGRGAALGVVPAAGGLAGAGAGAEAGAAIGAFGGPVVAAIGGVAGGLIGGFGGGYAAEKAQDAALSALPDDWEESINSQRRADQEQHPVASFLGGMAPYAVTMRPGGFAKAALPENATALQRIMAHPVTARVFGGAVMGGMEAGQEIGGGESPDWTKIGIATGFGLVFNKPTRIGEAITEAGARPVRALVGRAPTIAQAADAKVAGPGVTEEVFQGTHEQDPSSAMAAQDTARTEQAIIAPHEEPQHDLHAIARRIDPDTFSTYDELAAQRDSFRASIERLQNPPDEDIAAAQQRRDELQAGYDRFLEGRGGYTGGPEARRLRAEIRAAQADIDELNERRAAFGEGRAEETPEIAALRQHVMRADFAMRDLAPQVSAAYRRAAEAVGAGTIPPEPQAAPAAETPATVSAEAAPPPTEAKATPSIEQQRAFIVADVMRQLEAAGRPAEEAEAAAHLIAARYETRAARFGGALGTARELYEREGPAIRGQAAPKTAAVQPEKEFAQKQAALGRIRLAKGQRAVITLTQKADASTFVHETGHQWLEELMRDAEHEAAPNQLKDDAQTVRDWLGANAGEEIKTRQHEKFARGFEQYMREGVAPSPRLASVFAKFKNWLVSIYQTIKGLGKPINDDIRQVFDRLLAEEPKPTVIASEFARRPTLADIHEADANITDPAEAEAAQDRVDAERARAAAEPPPEVADELARAGIATGATAEPGGESSSGGSGRGEVASGAQPEQPIAKSSALGERATEVSKGVGEAGKESAGLSAGAGGGDRSSGANARTQPPLAPSPGHVFGPAESPFVDKAGNIRLDTLTSREEVAKAIRAAAEENDDFIGDRRGVVTDGQVMELADALGMDFEQLSARRIGQAFNAEQVMAARKLLVQSATAVSEAMRKAADGTDEDVMAYAMARDRHQMIQAQVAGITAEAGRALRAFRNISSEEGAAAAGVDQFIRTATGKTLYQLRQEAKLGAQLDTPQKISKFMADAQKVTFGRMVLEYWINGLISGPATHTTYMIGNTILALEKAGPETAAAALIGKAREAMGRQGETVRIGEVGARLKAIGQGAPAAVKASLEAFKTGVTTLLPGEDLRKLTPEQKAALKAAGAGLKPSTLPFQPGSELVQPANLDEAARLSDVASTAFGMVRGMRDGLVAGAKILAAGGVQGSPLIGLRRTPMGYIPDIELKGVDVLPLGNAVRMPGRFIAAIHSFFRSTNYSMEKAALAYRSAAAQGLNGTAFDAEVARLRQNPTPEIMEGARHEATELTLMGKGSPFVQALSRLTNTEILGFPFLKFIDPFVHIAGNIIDQSIVHRTPLGVLAPEIRADLLGKNGTAAQDMAMARMLCGTALSVVFGSLAAEGLASGSGPSDPRESAMWRLAGNQAHSIRIGDIWYDVHRLGPLGMLMGISADLYDIAHTAEQGELLTAASMLQHAFTQNILDESFMRGPADLIQAVEDPGRYGESYLRNFVSSFVPYSVGMAQMARAADPYSRQARTVMDAIKAKVPGLSETLFPRRDIWGEELPNLSALGAKGVTAIYEVRQSRDPVNLEMLRLGIFPAKVERKIRNIELTDQQYDDFSRIAGRMTKMRLDTIVNSPDFRNWPDHSRHDVISEVIRQSREAARNVVMMKYPQIMRDAAQRRIDQIRGTKPQ